MSKAAVVHFSGGSDSTLCAALLAESCDHVHLLSYDRLSFIGARNYTEANYRRLCAVYGRKKFTRHVIRVDGLHKRICFHAYPKLLWRYRLAVTALSFNKLYMHWLSAAYALRHGAGVVADGAVPYMHLYPDQNEHICLTPLRRFYQEIGIDYRNPVYHLADSVEQKLYDRGITETPEVRGTERDRQVYYLEQVILALFLKYYVTTHGEDGYEQVCGALWRDRIDYMLETVRAWQREPSRSFLNDFLPREAA